MSKINPCNTSILLCEDVVNIIQALLDIVFSGIWYSQTSKFFTPTIHFEGFFCYRVEDRGWMDCLMSYFGAETMT